MLEFSKYFFRIFFFWSRAAGLLTRRTMGVIPAGSQKTIFKIPTETFQTYKLVLDFLFRTFSVQLSIRTTK